MSKDDPTYPGGFPAILTQMEGRRGAVDYGPGEALPPFDLDLAPLCAQGVRDPETDPAEATTSRSGYARKRRALRAEFTGLSELCFLNGLLIAHLRKRDQPAQTAPLFRRLWAEQSDHLLAHLNPRWLVSSVTTFGDHPANAAQASVGLSLTVLFGTMKLYESERLYSGLTPDRPFPLDGKVKARLPMQMDAYALSGGGLDVNLLGRLWTEAGTDPTIGPLARHLLEQLIADDSTLFRRLATMRARKARRDKGAKVRTKPRNIAPVAARAAAGDAEALRWGLVTTLKAPVAQAARFAAHHLDLGAHALHLYLDAPEAETVAYLSRHPRIHITQCTDAWWRKIGKHRPEAHQLRQAHNATRTLRASDGTLDWLGHIDVDEFLLPDRPVPQLLSRVDPSHAYARILPAEALAGTGAPQRFKLTHKAAGQRKAVVQDIYPTFGLHLYGGFLSHHSGKVFARPGIPDSRLGIHTLKYRGEEATNATTLPDLYLGHFHAPSWADFRSHFDFRRAKGSYRDRNDAGKTDLSDIMAFLVQEEGDDGLRALFDEVCADTPELRARLAAHGMLLTREMDLDATVRRVFGALP
ncbi:glycosyltransferase family 2 protein [Thalassococcus sp. BH17M4-6]|uniref:glycosyltransferase family 2 protein n=1 Tax=Thalassococcus sp. BH17M4-6 TaxID=3413148 RepID=UPI003BC102DB